MTEKSLTVGGVAVHSVTTPVARLAAYATVPLSFVSLADRPWLNILAAIYVIAGAGLVDVIGGGRVSRFGVTTGYILVGWYCVLLSIQAWHGQLFADPLIYSANIPTSYFILPVFPFLVFGLQSLQPKLEVFDRVVFAAIIAAACIALYQFLISGVERPPGFSTNPIVFGMIGLAWGVWLFSRGLAGPTVKRLAIAGALVALVPVALSGSKLVWFCMLLTYAGVFASWAIQHRRVRLLAIVAATSVAAAGLLTQTHFVRSRLVQITGDVGAFLSSGDTSGWSFGLRYAVGVSAANAFRDSPWLGYGAAQVKLAAIEHRPSNVVNFDFLYHLHNEYLMSAVAFGLPGLLLLITLLLLFFLAAFRSPDPAMKRFGYAMGVALAVYMAAEVVFTHPDLEGLVFLALALLVVNADRPQSGRRA